MRATKVLLAAEIIVFAVFFVDAFSLRGGGANADGHAARGAFEFFGAAVSVYLLSKSRLDDASLLDWLGCAFAILVALAGFAGFSITLFALYLFVREPNDQNAKA